MDTILSAIGTILVIGVFLYAIIGCAFIWRDLCARDNASNAIAMQRKPEEYYTAMRNTELRKEQQAQSDKRWRKENLETIKTFLANKTNSNQ